MMFCAKSGNFAHVKIEAGEGGRASAMVSWSDPPTRSDAEEFEIKLLADTGVTRDGSAIHESREQAEKAAAIYRKGGPIN